MSDNEKPNDFLLKKMADGGTLIQNKMPWGNDGFLTWITKKDIDHNIISIYSLIEKNGIITYKSESHYQEKNQLVFEREEYFSDKSKRCILHREDGPAVIIKNKTSEILEWWENGKFLATYDSKEKTISHTQKHQKELIHPFNKNQTNNTSDEAEGIINKLLSVFFRFKSNRGKFINTKV